MPNNIIAQERMWLTADHKHLVADGDPEAATLYAAVGHTIPESAAKEFKVTDGYLSKASKAEAKAEDKAKAKAETEDKGAKPKPGLSVVPQSKRRGGRPRAKAK